MIEINGLRSDTDVSEDFGNTKNPRKRTSASKNWSFTLNNYTEENIEALLSWFQGSRHIYIFQEETGKDKKTKHLQGTVCFTSKCRPTENNKNIKEIHWEKTRSVKHSILYCQKQETKSGRLWTNIPVEKPLKLITVNSFWSWQDGIFNMLINTEPDDRTIHWYWDSNGCTGKTALAKYICAQKDLIRAICISGKSTDCKHAIIEYYKKNNFYPECIIFNVPRSNIDFLSYEAIESIKDGLFFSGKYEGGMVLMNPPFVLIFANEEPNYEKLSKDRWHVLKLSI